MSQRNRAFSRLEAVLLDGVAGASDHAAGMPPQIEHELPKLHELAQARRFGRSAGQLVAAR